MEGFKYIIQKQEQQKVCFGSTCPRDISKRGMSPFMRYFTLEDRPNIAPNSYNALQSFKAITRKPCSHSISKKGYSGIARFGKQVVLKNDYSSPLDYNTSTFPKQVHKSKYPFESNSKRHTFVYNTNPGPGMYVSAKREGITFEHSFGGRVKMKLGVDLKCCSGNIDVCQICGKRLTNDYWYLENEIFLCRLCMNTECEKQTKYKKTELKLFRKIRNCSIIHQHEGTTAKIWLMDLKIVAQWMRREAYLSAYLKE